MVERTEKLFQKKLKKFLTNLTNYGNIVYVNGKNPKEKLTPMAQEIIYVVSGIWYEGDYCCEQFENFEEANECYQDMFDREFVEGKFEKVVRDLETEETISVERIDHYFWANNSYGIKPKWL